MCNGQVLLYYAAPRDPAADCICFNGAGATDGLSNAGIGMVFVCGDGTTGARQ